MKNNQLVQADTGPYSDNARKIDAALDRIRNAPLREVIQPPAPETFELSCVCAVHDKPYRLRFTRKESEAVWHFSESMKLDGNARQAPAAAVFPTSSSGLKVSLSDLEATVRPCAWCGHETINHCRIYCGALVCGGRMRPTLKGWLFRCRASCGAEWVGTPLKEVEGTAQRQEKKRCTAAPAARSAAASIPPAPLQENSLALPGTQRLLLPASGKTTTQKNR